MRTHYDVRPPSSITLPADHRPPLDLTRQHAGNLSVLIAWVMPVWRLRCHIGEIEIKYVRN
jgi:hypothetical protein